MSDSPEYDDDVAGNAANNYMGREVVDDDDDDDADLSPSPRSALLSIPSNGNSRETLHLAERIRRSSRKDRDGRRSSTNRALLKLVISEELEVKQARRVLAATKDRLEIETRRAQQAERYAVDLAQKFKEVNDARAAAQQESARLREELSLYKVQLNNAQNELSRGQDILKDLETQRDDAEASAARARTTARKLREQQLVFRAREAGRQEGYREGIRRGYEQARSGLTGGRTDDRGALEGPNEDEVVDDIERMQPLDDFSPQIHLPSPPRGDIPLAAPSIVDTLDEAPRSRRSPPRSYPGGAEGSRFRENIASPGASTLTSLPPQSAVRPSGPSSWPPPPTAERSEFTHPQVIRTASPTPRHPDYSVPPDGWIPSLNADNFIAIPPPHELSQQPPASPRTPLSPLPPLHPVDGTASDTSSLRPNTFSTGVRDYAFPAKQRASPGSLAESLPSTTMSQFDLLSSPRRRGGERLSAIQEVSTSMELSPGTEGRMRSSIMHDPSIFSSRSPGPAGSYAGSDAGRQSTSRLDRLDNESNASGSRRRRSRTPLESNETSRLSNASVQEWLGRTAADEAGLHHSTPSRQQYPAFGTDAPPLDRTASPFDRPYSSASGDASKHRRSRSMNPTLDNASTSRGSDGHRRVVSSGSVVIEVQTPSAPTSTASPSAAMELGRLTPNSASRSLRASPSYVSTVPNSPSLRNLPSMGTLGSMSDLPPGFVTTGGPYSNQPSSGAPVPPSPRMSRRNNYSGSGSDLDGDWGAPPRTASRSSSRMANDALRPKTPGTRPSSAAGLGHSPSTRSYTPSQTNYVAAPGRPYTPSHPQYAPAPTPMGVRYTESRQSMRATSPSNAGAPTALSPRSSTSRLSGHQRSLSMHAGSTPAANFTRPLSGAPPEIRRVPSTGSISSNRSGYAHYDPKAYVDAAFLASSEDLLGVQSPGTMANTKQNANFAVTDPHAGSRGSPALSYGSFGGRN